MPTPCEGPDVKLRSLNHPSFPTLTYFSQTHNNEGGNSRGKKWKIISVSCFDTVVKNVQKLSETATRFSLFLSSFDLMKPA